MRSNESGDTKGTRQPGLKSNRSMCLFVHGQRLSLADPVVLEVLDTPNKKRPRRRWNAPGPGTERRYLPMQDEPTSDEVERELALAENTILHLMLDDSNPGLWSIEELRLADGDPIRSADAIAGLHASGLIHLVAGYAWPTRAAVRAVRIENCV